MGFVAVFRTSAALLAVICVGCISEATAGKLITESGGGLVARSVLDAAAVFGRGCSEAAPGGMRSAMDCGRGGGSSLGADLATLGVSAARAAVGVALSAMADVEKPAAVSGTTANGMFILPLREQDPFLSRARLVGRYDSEAVFPVSGRMRCERQADCLRGLDLDPRRAISRLQ